MHEQGYLNGPACRLCSAAHASHQPEALAHHQCVASGAVSRPVLQPGSSPIGDGGVTLAFIDGELKVHIVQGDHLHVDDLDGAERLAGIPSEEEPLACSRQGFRSERLIFRTKAGGCGLLAAEDSGDQLLPQLAARGAEFVWTDRRRATRHPSIIGTNIGAARPSRLRSTDSGGAAGTHTPAMDDTAASHEGPSVTAPAVWPAPRAVEIPRDADELTMLEAYLDHYRETFDLKCAGIAPARMSERSSPPSTMSLHGLA